MCASTDRPGPARRAAKAQNQGGTASKARMPCVAAGQKRTPMPTDVATLGVEQLPLAQGSAVVRRMPTTLPSTRTLRVKKRARVRPRCPRGRRRACAPGRRAHAPGVRQPQTRGGPDPRRWERALTTRFAALASPRCFQAPAHSFIDDLEVRAVRAVVDPLLRAGVSLEPAR